MFRKAMDYLGLGPDDAYDDYDASVAQVRPERQRQSRAPQARASRQVVQEYDDYEEEYDEPMPEPRGVRARPQQVRTTPACKCGHQQIVQCQLCVHFRFQQRKQLLFAQLATTKPKTLQIC